jgi:Protein of unknown function (DUF2892)
MIANVGNFDRLARLVIGALLVVWPFLGHGMMMATGGPLRWIGLVVGIVLIVTALARKCPAYSLIGVNTCKVK